jgi:hypothetical protein
MKRLRDDSGIAMVTALLATMVVAALAGAGFSVATHNLDQSAGDRRRVQAIHAAEAGIDAFLLYLHGATPSATQCPGGAGAPAATQTIPTTPSSQFTISVAYQRSVTDSTPMACPANKPGAAMITSVGRSGSLTSVSGSVTRTMQALYGLTPNPGTLGGFTGGVYSNGPATFTGHAQLNADPSNQASSGDIYSNGDLTLKGGGDVFGSVNVQSCPDASCAGVLSLQGGTIIHQGANSKDLLSISNNSQIVGNARSSLASITGGGSIGGTAYYCTGSAPSGATAAVPDCSTTLPLTKDWNDVKFIYKEEDWTPPSLTYNVLSFSGLTACDQAYTFLTGGTWVSGDYVLRINGTCSNTATPQPLQIKKAVALKGNLAIISDASFDLTSQGSFTSSTARNLFLMFNIGTTPPCNNITGINFGAQGSIGSNIQEVIYTPCAISFGAGSGAFNVNGQVYGGAVSFGGGASVIAALVPIPGHDGVGDALKMTYRREITG